MALLIKTLKGYFAVTYLKVVAQLIADVIWWTVFL